MHLFFIQNINELSFKITSDFQKYTISAPQREILSHIIRIEMYLISKYIYYVKLSLKNILEAGISTLSKSDMSTNLSPDNNLGNNLSSSSSILFKSSSFLSSHLSRILLSLEKVKYDGSQYVNYSKTNSLLLFYITILSKLMNSRKNHEYLTP
jgi:hypothetical protein